MNPLNRTLLPAVHVHRQNIQPVRFVPHTGEG